MHGFVPAQLRLVPGMHTPAWHASMPLQMFPSLHEAPFVTLVWKQPVAGLQRSVVQKLLSSHRIGVPAEHTPALHVSLPLQRLPSLHDVPFASTVCTQPVAGTQVSAVHGLLSLQFGGAPAVQTPARQLSAPLHRLPSLHEVPSGRFGC
jgi:hypothetical protein